LSVFENELQHFERILGRRTPGPKSHGYKGRIHLGELDNGGFEALAGVLVSRRVDLKGNSNLIFQNNSPSLASSLSSMMFLGIGGFSVGQVRLG
jgi:hypothetical protein